MSTDGILDRYHSLRPGEWRISTGERALAAIAAGVLSIILLLAGAYYFESMFYAGGFFLAAGAIFGVMSWFIVVAYVTCFQRGPNAVEVQTHGGFVGSVTIIPNSKVARIADYAWRAVAFVGFSAYLVRYFSMDRPDDWALTSFGMPFIALGFCICLLPGFFGRLFRRGRPMGLGLTKQGLYRWHRYGCSFFDWSQVTLVTTTGGRTDMSIELEFVDEKTAMQRPGESWIGGKFRKAFNRTQAGLLAIHPALAYRTVQYYHLHWDSREELGTLASLERIKNADFGLEHLGSPDRFLDELYVRDESGMLVENPRAVEHYRQNPDQLRALLLSTDSEALQARLEEEEKLLAATDEEGGAVADTEGGQEPGDAGADGDEPTRRTE